MSVYVGIDVHRKRSQVAVVTEDGTVQLNKNVVNGSEPFLRLIGDLPPGTPVAFEAAYGWSWLADLLEDYAFEAHLTMWQPEPSPSRGTAPPGSCTRCRARPGHSHPSGPPACRAPGPPPASRSAPTAAPSPRSGLAATGRSRPPPARSQAQQPRSAGRHHPGQPVNPRRRPDTVPLAAAPMTRHHSGSAATSKHRRHEPRSSARTFDDQDPPGRLSYMQDASLGGAGIG